jgi:type IV secretion system protein VirD4
MTTTAPPRGNGGNLAIIGLGALALAADGALWASSRLVGPPTPISPAALVRDLKAGTVPGTPTLVLAGLLLLLVVAATGVAVRVRRPKQGTLGDRARWASRRDLKALAVGPDHPGRIGLGQAEPSGLLLAAEARHSVCVLGPTGSGKTVSVVVPTLLDWTGPAIVTSVKADVLDATESVRRGRGPVFVFDPTNSTGRTCSTWSPLSSCTTWAGASQMAGWLTEAAGVGIGGDAERFWTPLARKLLGPLLFAAGTGGLGMADVVRWVDTQAEAEVRELLDALGVDEASNAFTASRMRPGNTLGSVYATAEAVLDVYTDPQAAASADGCEIDPAALLDGNGTLFLVAPAHAQAKLRPLFEALIMSVVREAQNRAQLGSPVDPGLLLLLDEAGNVAPLRDLPAIASTGRGQGIQLVSVWQDLGQIKDRYGRLANTVLTNHRGLVALSGISDLDTLDRLSRLLGDTEVDRVSTTAQAGGGQSRSTSQQRERLAPADTLRQLKIGHGLLIYGALAPVKVRFKLTALAARGGGRDVHSARNA